MKYISNLTIEKNNREVSTTNQKEIELEIKKYYEKLYSNQDQNLSTESISDFIDKNQASFQKLSDKDKIDLNADVTIEELGEALRSSKNTSSPGTSGLTYSFYKCFWLDLKYLIFRSYKYSFQIGKLPETLSKGVITLLPKGNKPRNKLENWRPITLLNSLYKIFSKTLANKINRVLPNIIHPDQCGFVKDRYIGECIRTTIDVMEKAKQKKITGLLLLIDFRKAFDSISFSFIRKTLLFFEFGQNMINWLETLLHNFKGCINHAGNLSDYFKFERGCKQGDPCSSLIFILCIEILCIKMRNCNNIEGFTIENLTFLLSMYADDCSIFLKYNETNLRNTIKILDDFYSISGLQIHLKKTQCVIFGDTENKNKLCADLGLDWNQEFKLLGVIFNGDTLNFTLNFDNKIIEIKKVTNEWKHKIMTPLGRLCIAKTLLLSKINHLAFVLPSLSKKNVKTLEDLIYDFIWQGKDKVARIDAKNSWKLGGMNMPDIHTSWSAFKLSWFRRMMTSQGTWVKLLLLNVREIIPVQDSDNLLEKVETNCKKIAKNLKNTFWSECFNILDSFRLDFLKRRPEEIIYSKIWGSNLFLARNRQLNQRHYASLEGKIERISDIMRYESGNSEILTWEEANEKYDNLDQGQYTSLRQIIRETLHSKNIDISLIRANSPFMPNIHSLLNMSKKGCGKWTNLKKRNFPSNNIRNREQKWNETLGRTLGIDFWDRCYENTNQIFFNNRLKWLQYQIIRGTLKTNRIISKFAQGVTNNCTFCNLQNESIIHLFWECQIVQNFIRNISQYFLVHDNRFYFQHSLKTFIFNSTGPIVSPINIAALYMKQFIWISRCRNKPLNETHFETFFQNELGTLRIAYRRNDVLNSL